MWILSLEVIGGFQHLAWSQRIVYLFLLYAIYANAYVACEKSIDSPWRKMYAFKALVCTIAWIYYTFLITGVFTATVYVSAARWIQVLIVMCMFTSAQLHKWERGNLRERKELERKLRLLTERDD